MWSPAEHDRMLEGLRLYKRDWAKVTRYVGTRSAAQVRSHAQKYFDRVARDKTDDYVPRARPKRKSSAPYPRKIRDDAAAQHHSTLQHPHPAQIAHPSTSAALPVPIPLQSVHPAAIHAVHQHPSVPHPMHTSQVPVQLASQSPLIQHMTPNSPYLAQPQQHPLAVQQGVPQPVYSPYLMCPPPAAVQDRQGPPVQASPVPHPSPMSYMSGHTYPGHSPALHQQVSVPQAQVYGMFSPMTPGPYPPSMTQSPLLGHGQVSLVATPSHVQAPTMQATSPQVSHFPTHSHPGGPVDNCAKCAALQRYGNVLQEIGAIRNPQMPQPGVTVGQGQCQGNKNASKRPGHQRHRSQHPEKGDGGGDGRISGSSPAQWVEDMPSSPSIDESKDQPASKGAADHRAHRAKVMKARKARSRAANLSKHAGRKGMAMDSERSSESYNSSHNKSLEESLKVASGNITKPHIHKPKKDSKGRAHTAIDSERGFGVSRQRPGFEVHTKKKARATSKRDDRPMKRMRATSHGISSKTGLEDISGVATTAANLASVNSSPATRVLCDRSEDSDGKQVGSPRVETYSPSERKEIFDAVKSLQILAKNSSDSGESGEENDASN